MQTHRQTNLIDIPEKKDRADCHRNHNGNRQPGWQQAILEIEQVKYTRAYIPWEHKYQWEKDKCNERTENILN